MCKKVVSKGLCKESRYEMLIVHSLWYDLFCYYAICQFQVPQSVTIESPGQVTSNMIIQIECRLITIGVSGFVRYNRCRYVTTRS